MPPAPERAPERTACLWCADWPVVALRSRDSRLHGVPVAVVERGDRGVVVRAASVEARAEQVVVGLRRREAEARCPGLVIVEADLHVEARTFETVARAVEVFTPRFVLEEPGRLELPTRGPSRYFGGDEAFAERVLVSMRELGIPDARLGIADGRFAALLAARAAEPNGATVVAPGDSPSFLAPWPVTALRDADLADLLVRLGLRTLGAFAALPPTAVLGRFGPSGARAHRLAAGFDERAAPPAPPPPDLVEHVELDPPVAQVETAVFAAKAIAERLLARLEALGLVCTRVMIEAQTEHGERLARCWRHEGALTAGALAARVRWQLEGWLTAKVEEIDVDDVFPWSASQARPPGRSGGKATDLGFPWSASQARPPGRSGGKATDLPATGGLILLRLVPDEVLPATGRQLGFWGGDAAATEHAERALARVQGMLGHPAVVTAVPQGGRTPAERVRWVPWGDPREPVRPIAAVPSPGANALEVPPWPGAIPTPSPARVFDPPLPAELLDASDCPVTVSSRGDPSASPARLRCRVLPGDGGSVTAWAGPWAHDVRWWDPRARSRRAHWQLLVATPDGDSVACLVSVTAGHATVEAIYD